MKKIGILTINDNTNYGNRLQNYAVQEVLKKFNCKVETIYNRENFYGIRYSKEILKNILKKILFFNAKCKRGSCFVNFNKNIKFSKYKIDKNHIPQKLNNRYDYFFTGSDQVWNPTIGRMSDIDFLTFAESEKRNSFSASFGISDIEKWRDYYIDRLKGLNKISVREERGKEIVEELTGRKDVKVLVDPTMLLTDKEWDMVLRKPKQLKNDKYILNYFLGNLSEERKKEIERIAKENNCEIINILDKNSPFYQTGPSEFLYLEKNAFLICTDSFHSSVFAILYNRPFIVFDREDANVKMNSRLDTLLKKFKLENRWYKDRITEEQLQVDYKESYIILGEERKKAEEFLENAIK